MDRAPLQHLAIIMDGNGRWAKKYDLLRSEGHKAGTEAAKTIVTECRKLNLRYLTLYAFSKENWSRPKKEVNFLFDLMVRFLRQEQKNLLEQSIRMHILGEWEQIPAAARKALQYTCELTKDGTEMVLNLALNYSGREEILRSCRKIIANGVNPEELDESVFRKYLYTADQPDPDLIIRTSGEERLSNYLIFQSAYSELYFTPVLWPDFNEAELHKALTDFENRQRRFGGLG